MPRKQDPTTGRFVTAERTTETTHRVTERLTVEQDDTLAELPPVDELHHAPGWDPGPIHPRSMYLAQRAGQWQQALHLLALWNASTRPREGWDADGGYSSPTDDGWDPNGGYRDPGPEWLIQQAVTVLRAGPGATPLELTMGRSI